jgi:hypothetical protein
MVRMIEDVKNKIKIKKVKLLLFIFILASISGCRPVFEIIGLAESQYFWSTDDGNHKIKLFNSSNNDFLIRENFPNSPRMHGKNNPKYYIGSLFVDCNTDDKEEFIVTRYNNRISYNQNTDHMKILYIYIRGNTRYQKDIPQDIDAPRYATIDDKIGYREYNSFDLIPPQSREIDSKAFGLVNCIYYGLPSEINELNYSIDLEIMHGGKLFSVDTTVVLSKSYYEYPLLVH